MKKILSYVLIGILAFTLIPQSTFATSEEDKAIIKQIQEQNEQIRLEAKQQACKDNSDKMTNLLKDIENLQKEIAEIEAGMDTSIWGRTAESMRLWWREQNLLDMYNELMNLTETLNKDCGGEMEGISSEATNIFAQYAMDLGEKIENDLKTKIGLYDEDIPFKDYLKETLKFAELSGVKESWDPLGEGKTLTNKMKIEEVDQKVLDYIGKLDNGAFKDIAEQSYLRLQFWGTTKGAVYNKGTSLFIFGARNEFMEVIPDSRDLVMKTSDAWSSVIHSVGSVDRWFSTVDLFKAEMELTSFVIEKDLERQNELMRNVQVSVPSAETMYAVSNAATSTSSHPKVKYEITVIEEEATLEPETLEEAYEINPYEEYTEEQLKQIETLADLRATLTHNEIYKILNNAHVAGSLYSTQMLIQTENGEPYYDLNLVKKSGEIVEEGGPVVDVLDENGNKLQTESGTIESKPGESPNAEPTTLTDEDRPLESTGGTIEKSGGPVVDVLENDGETPNEEVKGYYQDYFEENGDPRESSGE